MKISLFIIFATGIFALSAQSQSTDDVLNVLVQERFQVVAKYDFYDANKANADDASTWVVLGGNYNFNANTKLQVNYSIKQEEGIALDNNFANVQLQIGF